MFQEILVVDYITDYKSLTPDEIKKISENLINSQFILNCPNGTIVGIPIDGGTNNQKKIYYPMLSHISLPLKSGERAWVFEQKAPLVSYWLSRKVQNMTAEDLNFTHDDRARVYSLISNSPDAIQKNSSTFYDANMSVLPLTAVRSGSISRKKEFIGEPVSPYKSKSNDLSLQGSNGTLINLSTFKTPKSATIDIVAGLSAIQNQISTKNVENYEETVKPSNFLDTSPDDSSRIIISQAFSADKYYELPDSDSGDIPTISLKTDAIRIIAQNDLKIIVGPDETQSKIFIKNDGNIVITPSRQIKLSGETDNQPYIRYDEFRRVITGIEQSITTLQGGLLTIAAILDQVIKGTPPIVVTPETPPPTTPAIAGTTVLELTRLQTEIEIAMATIRSQKILGS